MRRLICAECLSMTEQYCIFRPRLGCCALQTLVEFYFFCVCCLFLQDFDAKMKVFLTVFHNFLYPKTVSRVLDQHFCINHHFGIGQNYGLFASKYCKNMQKLRKGRFEPSFGVCSTQMLVKIFNSVG